MSALNSTPQITDLNQECVNITEAAHNELNILAQILTEQHDNFMKIQDFPD